MDATREKAVSALHHIAEGNGVRKTAARYDRKAGAHAAALRDESVAASPSGS